MYYPMYVDPTYILIIIGVLLSLAASTKVKSTFGRYSQVRSLSGLTGAQTAERILRQAGIYDVGIARVSGDLTDHYDPSSKTLRLSDSVYGSTSVAAVSVAAMSAVMRSSIRIIMSRLRFAVLWCLLPTLVPVSAGL